MKYIFGFLSSFIIPDIINNFNGLKPEGIILKVVSTKNSSVELDFTKSKWFLIPKNIILLSLITFLLQY